MGRTHATRNLKHASSDTLEKLRDASAVLVAHEHQISPHLMTDLLLIREETTAALHDLAHVGIDWSWWTVILLKPDCLARELTESVLAAVSEHVTIIAQQTVHPAAEQIFAHYDDIVPLSAEFGVDVPAELRRIYLGQAVIVAIGHGPSAAARLRAVLGPTDPGDADQATIRGRFGLDTLAKARADGRLIDNLIHTSDHAGVVARDLAIWFGPDATALLIPPDPGEPS
jgi:nucleoside-diphosphate kinase